MEIKGDGITDNTAAIQEAIDAAHNAGGGTVHLPKGTYILSTLRAESGCLTLKGGVTLSGDGVYETILKIRDNNGTGVCGVIRLDPDLSHTGMAVEQMTIDGNKTKNNNTSGFVWFTNDAMDVDTRCDLTIRRVEIKHCSDYGFDPHEPCKKVRYENCINHGNGKEPKGAKYG